MLICINFIHITVSCSIVVLFVGPGVFTYDDDETFLCGDYCKKNEKYGMPKRKAHISFMLSTLLPFANWVVHTMTLKK